MNNHGFTPDKRPPEDLRLLGICNDLAHVGLVATTAEWLLEMAAETGYTASRGEAPSPAGLCSPTKGMPQIAKQRAPWRERTARGAAMLVIHLLSRVDSRYLVAAPLISHVPTATPKGDMRWRRLCLTSPHSGGPSCPHTVQADGPVLLVPVLSMQEKRARHQRQCRQSCRQLYRQ